MAAIQQAMHEMKPRAASECEQTQYGYYGLQDMLDYTSRICHKVIFEATDIEVAEMRMEEYWLGRIYERHNVTDRLSRFAIEIGQTFRAMQRNLGVTAAVRYWGIDV